MITKINPVEKHHITVAGNPEASRTIIFIHGFGTDQTAWEAVAAGFSSDFRIVLFDNVGAGRSAPEAFEQHRYLNLHAYADDLLEICRTLQLHDAIVIGHSAGAMIGLLATIKEPGHFSRIVLIGASPRYLDDVDYLGGFTRAQRDELYQGMRFGYAKWAEQYAPIVMANPDRPALAGHFADSLKRIPHDRALTVLCSILQSDHRSDIINTIHPTLIIQTKIDKAVPMEVALYLNQHIKGSRLQVIDAEGHFPHISDPEKVIEAIRPFIALDD